jgi:hypothetical protein
MRRRWLAVSDSLFHAPKHPHFHHLHLSTSVGLLPLLLLFAAPSLHQSAPAWLCPGRGTTTCLANIDCITIDRTDCLDSRQLRLRLLYPGMDEAAAAISAARSPPDPDCDSTTLWPVTTMDAKGHDEGFSPNRIAHTLTACCRCRTVSSSWHDRYFQPPS